MIYHFKPYDRETDEIGLAKSRYMDLLNAEIKLREIETMIQELINYWLDKSEDNELRKYYVDAYESVQRNLRNILN